MSAGRVDVHVRGDGAIPVLVVHGAGSAAKPMLRLADALLRCAGDVRVTAVGLAGYGSDAPDQTKPILEQHLDVLLQVTQAEPHHLIGHSMGGFLAAQLARRAPERVCSLSLIEPMLFGVLDPVQDADALALDRSIIRAFEEGRVHGGDDGLGAFIAAWSQTAWADLPEATRAVLAALEPQIFEEAVGVSYDATPPATYAQLPQPKVVLCGTQTLLPARRMAERLTALPGGGVLRWVEGAGHMDVTRVPEPFAQVIAAFLGER